METSREKTGFAPFLNEMARLELSDQIEALAREQNQDVSASPEQLKQAAYKASALILPLVTEVKLGNLPYLEISTKVEGFKIHILEDPLGFKEREEQ